MINEIKLTKCYQELVQVLDNLIPIKWDKILLFIEDLGDYKTANFIYYENSNIRFGTAIPKDFNYNDDDYDNFSLRNIRKIGANMRNEFINSDEEPFTTFAFCIDNNMQFEVKFGYEQPDYNMDDDRSDYGLGWVLDLFGIEPIGDVDKKELQDYHEFIAKYKDKKIF